MNSVDDFERLTPEEKETLCKWISANFIPRKTPNHWYTSYGLKHRFEDAEGGFYITNGQFKGAMVVCGFQPVNYSSLNWVFCLSQKSPALKQRR